LLRVVIVDPEAVANEIAQLPEFGIADSYEQVYYSCKCARAANRSACP
jgi:hypothetical protein